MRRKAILSVAAASCLCLSLCALSSCSAAGRGLDRIGLSISSKKLGSALKDQSLSAETRKLLALAEEIAAFSAERYGLGKEAASLRFLPGERESLAWRLTTAAPNSVAPASVSYFSDGASAAKAASAAKREGRSAFLEKWDSTAYLGLRPSPLIASFAGKGYARLAEWINLELFSAAYAKSKDPALRDAFPAFASEAATREYLVSKLTAASPLLGAYVSEKRDERTFAALFPDYRGRIEGLYAQKPLPPDLGKRRDFLSSTWIQDFRLNYPSRFMTNEFKDFGLEPISDAEMAAWRSSYEGWNQWAGRYLAAGESLRALVAQLPRR